MPEGEKRSPLNMFMSFDELKVAEQLTFSEFKLFESIRPSELLNQCWIKPNQQWKSHHVVSLIERTNRIAFWVSSTILFPERVSDRVKVFEKWIKIAEVKFFIFKKKLIFFYKINLFSILKAFEEFK